MKTMKMNLKGGLPTTTIVIIALIIMVIATILIFAFLPTVENIVNPGPCADTCYTTHTRTYATMWQDCEHSDRRLGFYPQGPTGDMANYHWIYIDGFEGYSSGYYTTLHGLRQDMLYVYEMGYISEESYHWFDCVAEAID